MIRILNETWETNGFKKGEHIVYVFVTRLTPYNYQTIKHGRIDEITYKTESEYGTIRNY